MESPLWSPNTLTEHLNRGCLHKTTSLRFTSLHLHLPLEVYIQWWELLPTNWSFVGRASNIVQLCGHQDYPIDSREWKSHCALQCRKARKTKISSYTCFFCYCALLSFLAPSMPSPQCRCMITGHPSAGTSTHNKNGDPESLIWMNWWSCHFIRCIWDWPR